MLRVQAEKLTGLDAGQSLLVTFARGDISSKIDSRKKGTFDLLAEVAR